MWKVKMTPAFRALARRVRLTLGSLDTLVERLSANPQSGDFLGHFHGFDVRQLRWSKFMVVFEVHEPSKTVRLTAVVPWSPDLSQGLSFRRLVKKIIWGLLAATKFIDEARELAEKFGIDIDFSDDEDDNDNLMWADGIPFGAQLCVDGKDWRKAVGRGTIGRKLICCDPGIGKTQAFGSLILAATLDKPAAPDRRYKSHDQKRQYRAEDRSIAEAAGNATRHRFDQSGQSLTTNTRGGSDLATNLYAPLTPYNHWLRASNVMAIDCVKDALGESVQWMWGQAKPDSVTTRSYRDLFAIYFFAVDVDIPWAADEHEVSERYFICSSTGVGKSLALVNWLFAALKVRETPAEGDFAAASNEVLWEAKDRAVTANSNGSVPLLFSPLNKSPMTNLFGRNCSTSYASYATTSYASYATTSYGTYVTLMYDSYHYGFGGFYLGVSYDVTTMFRGSYHLKINARGYQRVTTKSANNLVALGFSAYYLPYNYRSKVRHARQSESRALDLYLDRNLFSIASYSRDVRNRFGSNRRKIVLRGTRWAL